MEDLDRHTSSAAHGVRQLESLSAIGLDWDGEVVFQSDRFSLYERAIDRLTEQGYTYECFCTRREIHQAAQAPNGEVAPDGAYPGTCRSLSGAQRRVHLEQGRPPAIRLRAGDELIEVFDQVCGAVQVKVDDVVLRRNDGVPAYNLAVVVDDALQGIGEVVRGDDLLGSTPRQVLLQRMLGFATPHYLHVPLVLGPDRTRLAKRHGAATLDQLAAIGIDHNHVLSLLGCSLGLAEQGEQVTAIDLLDRFDARALPREPWILPADLQRSTL